MRISSSIGPPKPSWRFSFCVGQTPGELRGRSDRLHAFESIAEVEETLQRMLPLVREIARRPGQKESRWMHVLSGAAAEVGGVSTDVSGAPTLSERVQSLEEQVAALTDELRAFKAKLGE